VGDANSWFVAPQRAEVVGAPADPLLVHRRSGRAREADLAAGPLPTEMNGLIVVEELEDSVVFLRILHPNMPAQ
jgi:hypothetical protein